MREKIKNHYDKLYSENEKTFGKGRPEKIVQDVKSWAEPQWATQKYK